jgi:succinylarginine dihydrolase
VEIFVYGRSGAEEPEPGFPARQTLEASRAIARRHGLNLARTAFIRQSRAAINAGAFHNDVVAVSHEQCLFYHEDAFEDPAAVEAELTTRAGALFTPTFVRVPRDAVSLGDAVKSYLFNAQLLRLPKASRLCLIAPVEARETESVAAYLAALTEDPDSPIGEVIFVDVRESMRNGGGPACLRLRVALTPSERLAAAQGFFLTEGLADALEAWVGQHYREELRPVDLADPLLVDEAQQALDALTRILPLGPKFYRFQRG